MEDHIPLHLIIILSKTMQIHIYKISPYDNLKFMIFNLKNLDEKKGQIKRKLKIKLKLKLISSSSLVTAEQSASHFFT
jgi:hypothetical protein